MQKREDVPLRQTTPKTEPERGINYLLIIAVDAYENGINRLNNAVKDALAFKECLIGEYQFERKYCIELLDEQATRSKLINTFDELIDRVKAEDTLVFYFAGHGKLVKTVNEGYWLLADAISGKRASFLSNNEVQKFISNLEVRHVFGVVDSCFSGTLFRGGESQPPSNLYHFRSRYLLTAGRNEPVLDNWDGNHSPFADCLLEQLRRSPNQYLWVGDLCRKVLKNIRYNVDEQTPRGEPLQKVGHQGGEFVFIRKGNKSPKIIQSNDEQKRQIHLSSANQEDTKNIDEFLSIKKKEGEKLIYIWYAKKDEVMKKELRAHLSSLQYTKGVIIVDNNEIGWNNSVNVLDITDVILLLLSPDFINSQLINKQNIRLVMEKHLNKQSMVVPIFIRPCHWKNLPFAKIQSFPRNRKPISIWKNRDECWLLIIKELNKVLMC